MYRLYLSMEDDENDIEATSYKGGDSLAHMNE